MTLKKVLVVEILPEWKEVIGQSLDPRIYEVQYLSFWHQAQGILYSTTVDLIISPVPAMSCSMVDYYTQNDRSEEEVHRPEWILICLEMTPQVFEVCMKLGLPDILTMPLNPQKIQKTLLRIGERQQDPLLEIMDVIHVLVGLHLPKDKRSMVLDRVMRRAFSLGLQTFGQYLRHFRLNRSNEIPELVSTITTHTTSFFREEEQFDFLYDVFLPKYFSTFRERQKKIRIWSAACSTGEEVYSAAITILEFLRGRGYSLEDCSQLVEIIGTDVDPKSVAMAKKGIYSLKKVPLNAELLGRYFDRGQGTISHLVRVKDFVHRICRFEVLNLLAPFYPGPPSQCVFLRNVLIYFNSETIQQIVNKIAAKLEGPGLLFLGKSESLQPLQSEGLKVHYRAMGHSIYQKLDTFTTENIFEGGVFATLKGKDKIEGPQPPLVLPSESDLLKVVIVDSSRQVGQLLRSRLEGRREFLIVGEYQNPLEVQQVLTSQRIDLMILDVSGLGLEAVNYLQNLRGKHHPPIFLTTTLNYEDAVNTMKCLELGAVDYIERPRLTLKDDKAELIKRLKNALHSRNSTWERPDSSSKIDENYQNHRKLHPIHNLIVIGASTGGVDALSVILSRFPKKCPPILVVQHIPKEFSKAFAMRLSERCEIVVKEACHNEEILEGHAYVAPGGSHMKLSDDPHTLRIQLTDAPPVMGHRPSVDVLFGSAAQNHRRLFIAAALLTGMGSDGALGLKKLRDCGAHTIAQDEKTSVVFGMPKVAIDLGAAVQILPLEDIANHLYRCFEKSCTAA